MGLKKDKKVFSDNFFMKYYELLYDFILISTQIPASIILYDN